MPPLTRRAFVEAVSTTTGLAAWSSSTSAAPGPTTDRVVHLTGDGIGITPREYTALLDRLCRAREVEQDMYLIGGDVEQFEREWAQLLGKEAAVCMPSGTLANHLALRALAGPRRRVIVPEMSHVYNDTGDACQTLSGLTLLPLAPGTATFTQEDVEAVLARTASGRVATDVGAILIESPIRRLAGQLFDREEMERIAAFARQKGIGLHLDGARLFMACAYTGIPPAEYAAPFDTVYVSLWKYFNAGIGSILAGPRQVLDGMSHVRRMFGGNLAAGWPAALVARHFMDGFLDRLTSAVRVSEAFYAAITANRRFHIERIPDGTTVARLTIADVDPGLIVRRLGERGIHMPQPGPGGVFTLTVNETWNRITAVELVKAFEQAVG